MELKTVIDHVSKEKGIKREFVVEAVKSALAKILTKKYPYGRVEVNYNDSTGEVQAFHFKMVVDSEPEMLDEESEVNLPEAKLLDPECEVGDELGNPIEADMGRIDANISKQIIMEAISRAEAEVAYQQFLPFVGKVVSGAVTQVDLNGVWVNLGKVEGLISKFEVVKSENLRRGMAIDCLVQEVSLDKGKCKISLSRKDPELVVALFKEEVPEIEDGTVRVQGCFREAGTKTKLLVDTQERVNPVAVCIGTQGYRIQKVQHRLGGERIDIINYSQNPLNMLQDLLNKSRVYNVKEEETKISCEVEKDEFAKALGLKGSNVRLASQVLGKEVLVYEKGKTPVSQNEGQG